MKQQGGIDEYQSVTLEWIRGADPTLFMYDAHGAVVEKIKLAKYNLAALHGLFSSKFKKKGTARSLNTVDNPSAVLHHDAAGANPSIHGEPAAEPAGPRSGSSTLLKLALLGGIGALAALAIFAIIRVMGDRDSCSQDKLSGYDGARGDARYV